MLILTPLQGVILVLMSSYKLIQDVEADDKLLGPLSFRQFLYALISVALLYFSYMLFIHHGEIFIVITLPISLFAAFLAYPFGKDQPTEVWALAKIKFFVKPRKRIWAQSGIRQLVTINVPKKVEIQRTNGLSQNEVKSRLQGLANTIDSRGWATKNVSSIYQNPIASSGSGSDRLINAQDISQDVPDSDATDILDDQTSPLAQQMDQMLNADTNKRRQELLQNLSTVQAEAAAPPVATPQPVVVGTPVAEATTLASDKVLEQQLKNAYINSRSTFSNMHAYRAQISPAAVATTVAPQPAKPQSTPAPNPVIMNLSQRNDLNVSVISKEANRVLPQNSGPDEV